MKQLLAAVALSSLASSGWANEISLHYGYVVSDSFRIERVSVEPSSVSVEALDDFAVTVNFDYQRDQLIGLYYSHLNTQMLDNPLGDDPELSVQHIHLIGTTLYPQGNWTHRVSAGFGGSYFSYGSSANGGQVRFSGQIAIGTRYALTKNLEVGIEARWLPLFMNDDEYIFCDDSCSVGFGSDNLWNQFGAGMMVSLKF
ncbi:hypothetical protein [uncultured Umboniibacter sp.]|uniref:hypothetical protein n=1 Tax=uncultured Umboniibacter sp. TaxID=1798917 RepID=UPI002624F58A|nr:hypothetical protein [uncultured Umboniibacter sp.]